ncbi:MAG: hypothetical protein J5913_05610 [Prevotella sp.]|nr:hypothetical protein [Prevotella sp.]
MRKQIMIIAALFVAAVANAQFTVDMGKLFTIQNGDNGKPQPVELNEASTARNGVVFIGDTRPAEKIQDGKYRGMRVSKSRRFFMVDGKGVQYQCALAFRRAPQGVKKDQVVDVTLVPRSCMIQIKPMSDGKLTFYAQTNKVEGNNLYVAVRNGATFKNLATLNFKKDDAVTGKKDAPYQPQSCDYQYADGDELWVYSDGAVNLYALSFSGTVDATFSGSNPLEVYKAVRKAQK